MRIGTRRGFLGSSAGAAAALAAPTVFARGADKRGTLPNIVFILADDLARGDLSCYGCPDYRTPNIDRLAAGGIKLLDCYSNAPTCSPTRAALISGRYQYRFPVGLYEPLRPAVDLGFPPTQPSLPSMFRDAGYRTALIGKWHLGRPPMYGPIKSGYQRFFGVIGAEMGYHEHREMKSFTGETQHALYDGESPVQVEGYATDLFSDRAVDFIQQSKRDPFLLSLHYTAPHWPWESPAEQPDTRINNFHFDGGSRAIFARMVLAMDRGVGRVLETLEKTGAADRTIVVFTSDNGGERFSYHWPFRGAKAELWEGGIRVAGLVRWPGRIEAGSSSGQIVLSMDWLPTLATAAGIGSASDIGFDGIDVMPALTHARTIDRTVFWRTHRQDMQAVRRRNLKYVRRGAHEYLFDLANDPLERANLKLREPQAFGGLRDAFMLWNEGMPPIPDDARVPPSVFEALEALEVPAR